MRDRVPLYANGWLSGNWPSDPQQLESFYADGACRYDRDLSCHGVSAQLQRAYFDGGQLASGTAVTPVRAVLPRAFRLCSSQARVL